MYLGLMPPMYFNKNGDIVCKHNVNGVEQNLRRTRGPKVAKPKPLTIHDVMKLDTTSIFGYNDKQLEKFTGIIIKESRVPDSVYEKTKLMNQLTFIGSFMSPREVVN